MPQELFHDWNGSADLGELARAEVLDETLRDGIQSPSAVDPAIEAKIEILHLLDELAEVQQETGVPLEVYAFIGSSPIRQYAEEWDLSFIEKQSVEAISFAVKQGLAVTYVTEDTTRSKPDDLRRLFRSAIDAGARRLGLCDPVGHATPDGAAALVGFAREVAGPGIGLDWHGHNDRGLALA